MSVLIKGIDMPTKGNPITVTIYPNGTAEWEAQHITGSAIPVPPHGRLIDADALYKDLLEDVGYGEAERFNDYWLGEQPTIIPAEEGDVDG